MLQPISSQSRLLVASALELFDVDSNDVMDKTKTWFNHK